MPELPEVEALAGFLTEHAVGQVVARVDVAAISVLKTFDPPVDRARGPRGHRRRPARQVPRPRRRRPAPGHPPGPGGLAALARHAARTAPPARARVRSRCGVHLDDGAGFDLTEAGTQKRLAVYVVGTRARSPGIARLGPDPLADDFTADALRATCSRRDRAPDQGRAARPVRDRRHRQRLLRRDPARGEDVAVQARRRTLTDEEIARLVRRACATTLDRRGRALAAGSPPATSRRRRSCGMRVHGRTGQPCPVCGDTVREVSFADSSLAVLPDLPDRRQAARRPAAVPASKVTELLR